MFQRQLIQSQGSLVGFSPHYKLWRNLHDSALALPAWTEGSMGGQHKHERAAGSVPWAYLCLVRRNSLVLFAEVLDEEFTRPLQAFLREHDGLGFSHRIANHAFLMQAVHRSPVMSLPGAIVVVQRQKEQREHHFVDLIVIVVHEEQIIFCTRTLPSSQSKPNPESFVQPCAAANPAITLWLPSTRPAGRVAELGADLRKYEPRPIHT